VLIAVAPIASRCHAAVSDPLRRAIKAGRISATKTDTGDWSIDAAELHRVFPPAPAEPDHATPNVARLEAEIAGLREMSNLLRSQLEDVQKDRDVWREQADSTTLANGCYPAPRLIRQAVCSRLTPNRWEISRFSFSISNSGIRGAKIFEPTPREIHAVPFS
jgi:hypothetical protein